MKFENKLNKNKVETKNNETHVKSNKTNKIAALGLATMLGFGLGGGEKAIAEESKQCVKTDETKIVIPTDKNFEDVSRIVLKYALNSENVSEAELIIMALSNLVTANRYAAENGNIPQEFLVGLALASNCDRVSREDALEHIKKLKDISPESYERMYKDPNEAIRLFVAGDPRAPEELVKFLALDENYAISQAALKNLDDRKEISPETLRFLGEYKDPNYNVLKFVAGHKDTPDDVLEDLVSSSNPDISEAALENLKSRKNVSPEVLENLASDEDSSNDVLEFVAGHKDTPQDVVAILVFNKNSDVSKTALETLAGLDEISEKTFKYLARGEKGKKLSDDILEFLASRKDAPTAVIISLFDNGDDNSNDKISKLLMKNLKGQDLSVNESLTLYNHTNIYAKKVAAASSTLPDWALGMLLDFAKVNGIKDLEKTVTEEAEERSK